MKKEAAFALFKEWDYTQVKLHDGEPVVDNYHFHDMEEEKSYDVKVPTSRKKYDELEEWVSKMVGDEKDDNRFWLEPMETILGVDELLIKEIQFQH
jgi:hypothetical protein